MQRIDPSPLLDVIDKRDQFLLQSIRSLTYTIFLFVKSDIKTTLIPNTLFALATPPLSLDSNTLTRVIQAEVWLFLHLLQFDVSNQVLPSSIEEDTRNKPYRPIPSGRISVQDAKLLRWTLIPICLAYSLTFSAFVAITSTIMLGLTIIHNELGANVNWAAKNILNGLGSATFAAGTVLLVSPNRVRLDEMSIDALCISAALISTTIHAQDFMDVEGDIKVGRKTLPMLLPPTVARTSLHMLIVGWSIVLVKVWEIDGLLRAAYLSLSALVGMKYVLCRSVKDDRSSYVLYNLWLSVSFLLPGCYRLCLGAQYAIA